MRLLYCGRENCEWEKGVLEFYRLVCQRENLLSSSTLQAMTVSLVTESAP